MKKSPEEDLKIVENMVESILKEIINDSVISHEVHLNPERSYEIKPRAIVFKANNKDFDKIIKFIETQFPNVEILYATTGPYRSILRITKSMPIKIPQ